MREVLRQRGVVAQGFAEKLLAGAAVGVEVSSDWGSRQVVWHARMTFLKITEALIGYRQARSQWVEFSSA